MRFLGEDDKEYVCALDSCEAKFTKKAFNQRFCSQRCLKAYTSVRLKKLYDARKTEGRRCNHKGCKTFLSRYNPSTFCSIHYEDGLKPKDRFSLWSADCENI